MNMSRLKRWCSLLSGGVLVAGLLVGGLVATAQPAVASPDIRIYFEDSVQNSEPVKSVSASCQLPGERVLGGGGRLFFGENGVALQLLFPHPSNAYTVTAAERADGFAGSWYVRSYVVCGTAVSGWEFRESGTTTLPTGARTKQATVRCSAGKVVLGTGGVVGDVNRGMSFSGVSPSPAKDEVTVSATEDATDAFGVPNFAVGAYAICANEPPGHEVVVDFSQRADDNGIGLGVLCPAGKEVTGAGMLKGGDSGAAHTYSLWPRQTANAGQGVVDTRLWTTTERTWFVYSFAICVT